jgi:hypothetical protein
LYVWVTASAINVFLILLNFRIFLATQDLKTAAKETYKYLSSPVNISRDILISLLWVIIKFSILSKMHIAGW